MAKVNFNRKEFEKHIKLTKEIEEQISLFGTHFEEANDDEIILEIMPNRPDLFSLDNFIKSFQAFLGKNTGLRKYKIEKSEAKIIVDKSVEKIRPFSMAAIVKGVKFTDEKIKEIMQWQEKIHATLGRNRKKIAIGYYILDKIKFPVKYTADDPEKIEFIPLEMTEKMNALQILSIHPCGRDYGHLLEGCNKFPIYYDSNKQVLSLPPIINSNDLGKILPGTSNILVECTGSDLNVLKQIISLAVVDLIEAGGKAYSVDIVYGDKIEKINLEPEKMNLDLNHVNKLLGLNLNEQEVKKLLEKMGYQYFNKQVLIPSWRTDIMHEVDLIEDISIAYGITNFQAEIPPISTIGEIDKKENIKKKISEILTGLGCLELSTYHLLTKEDLRKQKAIEVLDSKSDYKFLRPDLLTSVLKVLSENIDAEYPQKIFEIGTSFTPGSNQEKGVKESDKLVIALIPGNFTELKQALEYLARMLNISFSIDEAKDSRFIEGRTSKIIFQEKEIGVLGEIHPLLLRELHLKLPLACLELDLENIFEKLSH